MKIVETYSHLNGLEYLLVHKKSIWVEICRSIESVDAELCRTKISKEKKMKGKRLYAPKDLNREIKNSFSALTDWQESRTSYWVTSDATVIRKIMNMEYDKQKQEIIQSGLNPIHSHNQTDFVKDKIAVEIQFGKYAFVAFDLFVKHMAFYVSNKIDVGIEVLPMKSMQSEMSSGIAYYEGELYNLIREGRGVPAVPLVLVGVAP